MRLTKTGWFFRLFAVILLECGSMAAVLINELIVTPISKEAIELCNTADTPVDIGGWTLDWEMGTATIDSGVTIPANGYVVIDDDNTDDISLPNAGSVISVVDNLGNTVDRG